MFPFLLRLVRNLFLLLLGGALVAKLALENRAEPDGEEIDMVAIFGGRELASEADPFYGGMLVVAFGGVLLDLRKVVPSPTGIVLDVAVCFGGVSLVVPMGWRVRWQGNMYGGGFSDATMTTAEPDVPVVIVKGFIAMGGLQASTGKPMEAAAR